MTTDMTPADLLAALGVEQEPVEWRTTSIPPVEESRFGKDHYSTLLYVEVRAVDHHGLLDHEHMRCDNDRHPIMYGAKANTLAREAMIGAPSAARTKYPTFLRDKQEQPDHDDYDCLDDMLAAGWLTVTMPQAEPGGHWFEDARGHQVLAGGRGGEIIDPGFVTGMDELWLCTRAKWGLTDLGSEVTAALRKHKADGGTYATFRHEDHIAS